jgi:hypothetical protein
LNGILEEMSLNALDFLLNVTQLNAHKINQLNLYAWKRWIFLKNSHARVHARVYAIFNKIIKTLSIQLQS